MCWLAGKGDSQDKVLEMCSPFVSYVDGLEGTQLKSIWKFRDVIMGVEVIHSPGLHEWMAMLPTHRGIFFLVSFYW